jgi:flagellar biosynthesis protein FliR
MQSTLCLTVLPSFLLVAARMAGMVLTAPLFGLREVPWPVRVLLPVTLALIVTPLQWSVGITVPQSVLGFVLQLGGEAMIGAVLGVGVMILLAGAQIAGQIISQMSGLSMAEVYGLDGEETSPLFSHLLYMLALAVFVMIGGHRMLIGALLDSYVAMPLGRAEVPQSLGTLLATLATESFSLGIRGAAPAIVALLLSTVVLGFVSRTLPQVNMMTVGFGLNIAVTFVALAVSTGAMVWLFQEQLEPGIESILNALRQRS